MAKKRLRPGRVAAAMLGIVVLGFGADSIRRNMLDPNSKLVVSGNFKSGSAQYAEAPTENQQKLGNMPETTTAFMGVQNLGYSELSLPSSRLAAGNLAIVDEKHPAGEVSVSGMVSLNSEKNPCYSLVNDTVVLNKDAAEALNRMMSDYNEATSLADFIVYGTTGTYTGSDSLCPRYFPESAMGTTVDLALMAYGAAISYDGCDAEGWIIQNCARYGFIVRYPKNKKDITSQEYCPWHLRYVGDVHASIMTEKGFCLEEYIDFLKDHTYDNAFAYNLNGVNYEIYSAVSLGDSTPVRVPVSGNYTISGNNSDRYIITTIKN